MNKIDVLSKINEGMRAVLAKEDELAGNANDTSAGFEQMRLNYTAGRAYWVEGGGRNIRQKHARCGKGIPEAQGA